MLISIIIPAYNAEKHISNTVQSIVNQKENPWELLVVDDGSTDETYQVCLEWAKKDSRIKAYTQKNQGSGVARQLALDNAQGEYILFVDADDELPSHALSEVVYQINQYKADLYIGGYTEVSDKGEHLLVPNVVGEYTMRKVLQIAQESNINIYPLWNKIYCRNFLLNNCIRFGSQRVGQDALFNFEVFASNPQVYVCQSNLYYYDTEVEDSAVKKYRNDRFDLDYNVAYHYEKLLGEYGLANQMQESIDQRYLHAIMTGILNVFNPSSPESIKEKIKELKRMRKDNRVYPFIKPEQLKRSPFIVRCIILMFRNHLYWLVLLLVNLYYAIKR